MMSYNLSCKRPSVMIHALSAAPMPLNPVKSCEVGVSSGCALWHQGLECSWAATFTPPISQPLSISSWCEEADIGQIESSRDTTAEVGRTLWQDEPPALKFLPRTESANHTLPYVQLYSVRILTTSCDKRIVQRLVFLPYRPQTSNISRIPGAA